MALSDSPDALKRLAKRRKLLRKLRSKYRAVLIDESTYEERFSLRLSRINVIALAVVTLVLYGALIAAIIVFTPLKQYIPGYTDQRVRMNAYRAMLTADSLDQAVTVRTAYINNLRNVLSGKLPADSATLAAPVSPLPTAADLAASPADSLMREQVGKEEAFSVHETSGPAALDKLGLPGLLFFPPLRGVVTDTFNLSTGHYGIDIVTKADAAVSSCLDGTVIMASWTSDAGYVIQVQHSLGLVSVYKHNAVLLKEEGDRVKAGEAIAIVGNSGELTTGPHLHFELWSAGAPVDPLKYIAFK